MQDAGPALLLLLLPPSACCPLLPQAAHYAPKVLHCQQLCGWTERQAMEAPCLKTHPALGGGTGDHLQADSQPATKPRALGTRREGRGGEMIRDQGCCVARAAANGGATGVWNALPREVALRLSLAGRGRPPVGQSGPGGRGRGAQGRHFQALTLYSKDSCPPSSGCVETGGPSGTQNRPCATETFEGATGKHSSERSEGETPQAPATSRPEALGWSHCRPCRCC